MHCPFCRSTDTRVLDSRVAEDGSSVRRRRTCPACERRFSTVEQMQLMVCKRSGATEPFTRDKAVAGVRKACKGRPVSEDDLARLGQLVENDLRAAGWAEVPAHEVGLAILAPLKRSTPWPTSASRASTSRSPAPTTSRARSRCCAPPRLSVVTARLVSDPDARVATPSPRADPISPVRLWGSSARGHTRKTARSEHRPTRERGT